MPTGMALDVRPVEVTGRVLEPMGLLYTDLAARHAVEKRSYLGDWNLRADRGGGDLGFMRPGEGVDRWRVAKLDHT
eukprot:2410459-Prymnesium_polylepis.1